MRNRRLTGLWLIGAALAATTFGCGKAPAGTVAGKVYFQDAPIPFGTLALVGQDGSVCSGMIRNGIYTVSEVPIGPARISIQSQPSPLPLTPQDGKPPKPEFLPIPERYADSGRSGLSYTVVAGRQTHDVRLQP